jgi:hypothetical protein
MQWRQSLQEDRGQIWTDYVSDCGKWRIEQGHSMDPDEVWSLFTLESGKKKWLSSHRTLNEAKTTAEAQNNS